MGYSMLTNEFVSAMLVMWGRSVAIKGVPTTVTIMVTAKMVCVIATKDSKGQGATLPLVLRIAMTTDVA